MIIHMMEVMKMKVYLVGLLEFVGVIGEKEKTLVMSMNIQTFIQELMVKHQVVLVL